MEKIQLKIKITNTNNNNKNKNDNNNNEYLPPETKEKCKKKKQDCTLK